MLRQFKTGGEEMAFRLNIESRCWPLREPFVISRSVAHEFNTMQVTLMDDRGHCPIRLCADELVNSESDLERAKNRFDVINIKLEKAGGLTAALDLADRAQRAGFDLMVGTMGGSSLGMAPAVILAQRCEFVDLDGPLLQLSDWPDGLVYKDGVIEVPQASFWG
jgi:L-alanine-DL-glutamate epimerase-like enolase superfamily enzyme